MKEYIKEVLVEMHAHCTTDGYGQMEKFNLGMYSLFGKRTDEVLAYIKTDPIIEVSTYSGAGGVYKAISRINDKEIAWLCYDALSKNPNRLRNLNSY
jgi:hypothetical protein